MNDEVLVLLVIAGCSSPGLIYVVFSAWFWMDSCKRWRLLAERWQGIAEQNLVFSNEQSASYRKIIYELAAANIKLQEDSKVFFADRAAPSKE